MNLEKSNFNLISIINNVFEMLEIQAKKKNISLIIESKLKRVNVNADRVERSGNRSTGGSGLGLAIVKHIIDAHNEKIYVESDFGVGSEFSFSLQKSN